MIYKLILTLSLCLVALGEVVHTTTYESWGTESTPYCGGLTECECEDEVNARLLTVEDDCCPCVCKEEGWCRSCVCPRTAGCQCVCEPPNSTITDPVTHEPPPISLLDVTAALYDVKENVTRIYDELQQNQIHFWDCFTTSFVKPLLGPVKGHSLKAAAEAENALEILSQSDTLDNPELLRSLDALQFRLLKAKERLHQFTRAIAQRIADDQGNANATLPPFDWDNPDDTITILADWNPGSEACEKARELLLDWHPTFWFWNPLLGWGIWHRLCWYWMCIVYIRVTIIVKAWWWWFWRPWQWLWPFHWCFWWPFIPFLGGGAEA